MKHLDCYIDLWRANPRAGVPRHPLLVVVVIVVVAVVVVAVVV